MKPSPYSPLVGHLQTRPLYIALRVRAGMPQAAVHGVQEYEGKVCYLASLSSEPRNGQSNADLLAHLRRTYGITCEIVSGSRDRHKLLKITSYDRA